MEDIKNLLEEIPDMDLQDAKYEVWVLGYSADGNITDFEVFVGEHDDPEAAIAQAKSVVENKCQGIVAPDNVAHLVVQVETVVEVEEDETANVGTIFEDSVSI